MSETPQQLHAVVHGHVHGVSFRYNTQRVAEQLSLDGWVRNADDGTVEVVAEGSRSKLDELLAFLHKGPPAAQVTAVDVEWSAATRRYDGFKIRSNRFCNG